MVDSLGHVNAVAGAPAYNGRMLRQLNAVAFAGATAARPLGARSGVRPGTPATTVTATPTTWTCQPFAGILDGQVAGEAGPYPFSFDAVAAGGMTAANASNPRIDIIYVDVDDPSEDASSVPAVTRKYLAGTAAGSPSAPSAPAGCMTVAHINVPKSGAGSPTVTWVAPYCAAAGGTMDFNTKAELDAWTTAPPNQRAKVLADGAEYSRVGSAWVSTAGAQVPVVPSSVTGAGVTMAADGSITFAAATSIAVNGCFRTGRRYLVKFVNTTSSAVVTLTMALRAGGSPLTTGYDKAIMFGQGGAAGSAPSLNATNGWELGAGALNIIDVDLVNPGSAAATLAKGEAFSTPNPGTSAGMAIVDLGLLHRTAVAADGFAITITGGNAGGTVRIYEYN